VPSDQQATVESLRQQLRAYREEIARAMGRESGAQRPGGTPPRHGTGCVRDGAILTFIEDMSTPVKPVPRRQVFTSSL